MVQDCRPLNTVTRGLLIAEILQMGSDLGLKSSQLGLEQLAFLSHCHPVDPYGFLEGVDVARKVEIEVFLCNLGSGGEEAPGAFPSG